MHYRLLEDGKHWPVKIKCCWKKKCSDWLKKQQLISNQLKYQTWAKMFERLMIVFAQLEIHNRDRLKCKWWNRMHSGKYCSWQAAVVFRFMSGQIPAIKHIDQISSQLTLASDNYVRFALAKLPCWMRCGSYDSIHGRGAMGGRTSVHGLLRGLPLAYRAPAHLIQIWPTAVGLCPRKRAERRRSFASA